MNNKEGNRNKVFSNKNSRISSIIDHTLLKPDATEDDIKRICEEALTYGFATVCVNPCWVRLVHQMLKQSNVKTCTVIGFPLGANTSEVKTFEAKNAINDGAKELDMVINIGALKSKKYSEVKQDIERIVEIAAPSVTVKVILETSLLTDEEKKKAAIIAMEAGANFVKTSTGFGPGGATVYDVKLLKDVVGNRLGIKAAGGIRTYEKALQMISAGAIRIGTSSGVQIVEKI